MEDKEMEIKRERAKKVHALLDGKASIRVVFLMARAYLYGGLEKPLDELTDEELLAEPLIGPKTVEEIRSVIPSFDHWYAQFQKELAKQSGTGVIPKGMDKESYREAYDEGRTPADRASQELDDLSR